MACNRCNSCGCNSCELVQTTSISVIDSQLVLEIPNNEYVNHQMVCIQLGNSTLAVQSPPLPVKVGLGGTTELVDVITENGNYLYTDQLYKRSILRVMVATDSSLMVKRGCFNRTSVVFPEPLEVEVAADATVTNSAEG